MTKTLVEKWHSIVGQLRLSNITTNDAATILEQQTLYNETLNDVDADVNSHKFLSAYRRMSIPIVARILQHIKFPQLVGFDPVADAHQPVEGHMMKTILTDPSELRMQCNCDPEAELSAVLGQELALELDMFVLNELRDNAGIVCYIDPTNPTTEFIPCFCHIVEAVRLSSGFAPNWVVASTEVAEYLSEVADDFDPASDYESFAMGLRFQGTLSWRNSVLNHQQRLYENMFAPEHELLMGYKGEDTQTFTICPKVFLEAVQSGKQNQKIQKARIRSQFETVWPIGGGKLYARINVKAPD